MVLNLNRFKINLQLVLEIKIRLIIHADFEVAEPTEVWFVGEWIVWTSGVVKVNWDDSFELGVVVHWL